VRSTAAAIAWELLRRHRWGWIAVVGYLLGLTTVRLLMFEPGPPLTFDNSMSFAFAVIVPGSITFMYFLAVFSYGLAGDLAARRSMYPARMFTLPVTSSALAGWPMLYGTVAMALLWAALRSLAVWPSELDAPSVWPALFAAVMLAWTQALTWMPYALPGARVIVAVLLLIMIDVVVLLAIHHDASEPAMLALLAPHLPLAYLVARFVIARARRGEAPDWSGSFAYLGRVRSLVRRRDHFASPAHAQVWFEWRRYGRSLPALVGILLPFELSMLYVFSDAPSVIRATLLAVLVTPPFMAAFVAATVSRSSPEGNDSYELTPFTATRPLTSAALVSAKLLAAIPSALASWLLVLIAIPIALRLSGTSWVVVDDARRVVEIFGTPRAIAIGLLGISALVVSTWKRLVQSLFIGMSGRAWLVKASVFGTLVLLTLFAVVAPWVLGSRGLIAELLHALPWVLTILVGCKVIAAAWIAVRLQASRLVSDRALIVGVLLWDVAVLSLFSLFLWLVPTLLFRIYGLALVAILAIPLARLSASPLALAWNRHR